jgi:hypothetical protein
MALALRKSGVMPGDGIRSLIEQTGFWSVWLTIFWAAAPERELIASLFAPPQAPRFRTTPAGVQRRAGPSEAATLLRGTSEDFLS